MYIIYIHAYVYYVFVEVYVYVCVYVYVSASLFTCSCSCTSMCFDSCVYLCNTDVTGIRLYPCMSCVCAPV